MLSPARPFNHFDSAIALYVAFNVISSQGVTPTSERSSQSLQLDGSHQHACSNVGKFELVLETGCMPLVELDDNAQSVEVSGNSWEGLYGVRLGCG